MIRAVNRAAANNTYVESLGSSLNHGGAALITVPKLVIKVIETEAWREFQPRVGSVRHHQRFEDFVTAAPLDGIGSTMEQLRDICRSDTVALDAIDQAVQNRPALHIVKGEARAPTGNRSDVALRRLRKSAPELHAEVLAGHLSAHAAMVQAGFRPRTISVRLDDPDAIARTLRRHLTTDQLAVLAAALEGDSTP